MSSGYKTPKRKHNLESRVSPLIQSPPATMTATTPISQVTPEINIPPVPPSQLPVLNHGEADNNTITKEYPYSTSTVTANWNVSSSARLCLRRSKSSPPLFAASADCSTAQELGTAAPQVPNSGIFASQSPLPASSEIRTSKNPSSNPSNLRTSKPSPRVPRAFLAVALPRIARRGSIQKLEDFSILGLFFFLP
ncbi:unnamed protein product [Fraxinus pennsylvanica]|uniref:Uncharacterized protein n=1 Tax=Fraxinus pennsylvanica TaxID=56036 RepID=A0AAD2E129_9LAMI|nr:unnamed protein product [Fraxinus pennsylvanica]